MIKGYIKLILIANVIAIPLSEFMGKMEPLYYKQDANYSQLLWVGVLSIVVTLLTISIQVIKSSYANPVKSLRYE